MNDEDTISIGGASGFWGDASLAVPQLLAGGKPDYLVFDYLAEITMSITARARAADPDKGYATDFVSAAMGPNLKAIAASGVKVISNAGGVNPAACARALQAELAEQGLSLRVAVVEGDDLLSRAAEFVEAREMFSGDPWPPAERIASINAYLGAFPIAAALAAGADIVITGRCVDSAVTLGACIHAFNWHAGDLDKLAQGSLAGHLLECGTQVTGGNFTDWDTVPDLVNAGYPIAEVGADGSFVIGKAAQTGGLVSVGTVGEQLLYEIGNPACYALPDVVCDFTGVTLVEEGANRVRVQGARGYPAPIHYKVSATWADGYRAGQLWTLYGANARAKAELLAEQVFQRTERALEQLKLAPQRERRVELQGAETHKGAQRRAFEPRELDIKLAVKHEHPRGVGVFLKEMVGLALTAPPGLTAFAGARPKPTPVVRLFSFLLDRREVPIQVSLDGEPVAFADPDVSTHSAGAAGEPAEPPAPPAGEATVNVPLESLAYGRSGDKGDKANIGLMARHPDFLPWIAAHFTEERVADYFRHFLDEIELEESELEESELERHAIEQSGREQNNGAETVDSPATGITGSVERFYLPGINALNFLLHRVLGGGGIASLRADPQGKGYAQLLLCEPVSISQALAEAHGLTVLDDTEF